MTSPQNRSGFLLQGSPTVLADVAHVLGGVGKTALRSVSGVVNFDEVFNCMSTLKHLTGKPSYIANEGGPTTVVSSWDNYRLARFLTLVTNNEVEGLTPSEAERESLRILSASLSHAHVYPNLASSTPA